jgi:hypothetical protein
MKPVLAFNWMEQRWILHRQSHGRRLSHKPMFWPMKSVRVGQIGGLNTPVNAGSLLANIRL